MPISSQNQSIDLSIIIISFNTKRILENCLKSILQQPFDKIIYEIIVVDNASSDGSRELILNHFPQVKIIRNRQNTGFAIANNQAAKEAKGKYLLFLNSDTIIVEDAISKLLHLAQKKSAKISTCKLLNKDNSIQPQGGYLPNKSNIFAWMTLLDDIPLIRHLFNPYQLQNQESFKKDIVLGWVSGTILLIESIFYHQIGGFDEAMFMYGEDVELCLRASQKNVSPYYFATPSIIHLGHQSGSKEKAIIGEYKGLIYIFQKHLPSDLPMVKSLLRLGAKLRLLLFSTLIKNEQKKQIYQNALAVVG